MLRQEGARVAGKMVRLIDHFLPLMSSDETGSGRQRQGVKPVAVPPDECVDPAGSFYFRVTGAQVLAAGCLLGR
jgi:hypothetical protein